MKSKPTTLLHGLSVFNFSMFRRRAPRTSTAHSMLRYGANRRR